MNIYDVLTWPGRAIDLFIGRLRRARLRLSRLPARLTRCPYAMRMRDRFGRVMMRLSRAAARLALRIAPWVAPKAGPWSGPWAWPGEKDAPYSIEQDGLHEYEAGITRDPRGNL